MDSHPQKKPKMVYWTLQECAKMDINSEREMVLQTPLKYYETPCQPVLTSTPLQNTKCQQRNSLPPQVEELIAANLKEAILR
jgi:hypothetical protein